MSKKNLKAENQSRTRIPHPKIMHKSKTISTAINDLLAKSVLLQLRYLDYLPQCHTISARANTA